MLTSWRRRRDGGQLIGHAMVDAAQLRARLAAAAPAELQLSGALYAGFRHLF
jgi:hypothetical protein